MKRILCRSFIVLLLFSFSACGKNDADKIYLSEKESEATQYSENDLLNNNDKSTDSSSSNNILMTDDLEENTTHIIYVQVNGAVNNPGVYKLEEEMRVFEVIELAGGITTDGATQAINMARPVTDEMVIYVPTKEEVLSGFSEETETVFEEYNLEDNTSVRPVNINTASVEELMTLSGIGETKAKQIIDYREKNGSFKDISEIMNISGIKQAAYEKIKDYITV